MNCLTCTQFRS